MNQMEWLWRLEQAGCEILSRSENELRVRLPSGFAVEEWIHARNARLARFFSDEASLRWHPLSGAPRIHRLRPAPGALVLVGLSLLLSACEAIKTPWAALGFGAVSTLAICAFWHCSSLLIWEKLLAQGQANPPGEFP